MMTVAIDLPLFFSLVIFLSEGRFLGMADVFVKHGKPVGDQTSMRIVFRPGDIPIISCSDQLPG